MKKNSGSRSAGTSSDGLRRRSLRLRQATYREIDRMVE
jgi:hypothetical protein